MMNPSLPKQIKTSGEDREIANDENEEQALRGGTRERLIEN